MSKCTGQGKCKDHVCKNNGKNVLVSERSDSKSISVKDREEHFNTIKFTKPIPGDQQIKDQFELEQKLEEELPYFLAWLAKSRSITIINGDGAERVIQPK